jgi:hypothetical protein
MGTLCNFQSERWPGGKNHTRNDFDDSKPTLVRAEVSDE